MSNSTRNDSTIIESSRLQQMKQDLIKTKPPIQTQVKEYYEQLVSQLYIIMNQGISDDKYIVLFNDTLSICLLRSHALSVPCREQNLIFDYILQFINHPFPPLQNSLQSLLQKLLMFEEGAEIQNWIEKIMSSQSSSLSKNLYLLLEILLKRIQDKKFFYNHYPTFPEKSISLFDDKVANAISKTLHVVYDGLYTDDTQQWYLVWKEVVKLGLYDPIKRNYVVTYLLPNLIKKDTRCFKLLMNDYSEDLEILLSLLNMGQKLQIIDHNLENEIDSDILANCLVSDDANLRLNSLALLLGVEHRSLNSIPISKSTFELIKNKHLVEINLNDSDNQDKFLSIFYRFLAGRFKNSLGKKNSIDSIRIAQEFLSWLLDLLESYLQQGSNFQQAMGSIIILGYICDKLQVDIFGNLQLIKLLTKLLFSDFKAIRNSSLDLLTRCNSENLKVFLESEEHDIISYSFKLLSSLTGRVSEGGAKALQFLCIYYSQNEKEKLSTLLQKLVNVIGDNEGYVHGHFTALNLIISSVYVPISVCQKLLDEIILVWNRQKSLLSLEVTGYEDDDYENEDEADIDQGAVKRNYSWKLVKYSNELMITILEKYPESIGDQRVSQCSELVMDQLSSIKHKGAFTSIYPSFIRLCSLCLNGNLKNLPRIWLNNNLELIRSKSQLISRRSGGIPYLITGILIANKKDLSMIDHTFTQLLQIADEEYDEKLPTNVDLPQVHAYNTLKQIFIESNLANECVRFIQDSLLLCLSNFASSNWSIRNCAVMLFGSIKQRIFGNNEKYSANLFFSRFPKLKNIILGYLSKFRDNEENNQTIFPIMMILAQLDFKDKKSVEFIELLKPCLGESSWKVRELAAHAFENLLSETELCTFAESILDGQSCDPNTIHGFLLCLLYGVPKINDDLALKLQQKIQNFIFHQPYVITNALINILAKLEVILNQENLRLLKSFFNDKLSMPDTCLDGGLQLLLNTLSTYLLKQYNDLKEIRNHIQLALKSSFFNVRVAVLEFIDQKGVEINIADIVWDLIIKEDFSYVLSRALRLYSKLNNNAVDLPAKMEVLSAYLSNINENVRLSALECSGACIREESSFSSEFLSLCANLSQESNPLDFRKSSNIAMTSYIRTSGERGNLYSHCVLLVFERGLYDDDEEIRFLSTKCLTEVCGRKSLSDSYFMSRYFPSVASSIIPEKYYSSTCFSMLMRNTLDQDSLQVIVEKKKSFSLYAHEKDALHKNESELISNICKFPIKLDRQQWESLTKQINADIKFVKELKELYGNNYWASDYVLYEAEYKTNMIAKLLLLQQANKDDENKIVIDI
ncbi:hypothetical protein JA1_003841 [Spathaspora sp. JA1]|nr:hypothetical protein JA1_003841 [Spathaspora sp. JA1]